MKDKFYKKLNRQKPSRSVLDEAYAEMSEEKRAKRSNPRRTFGMLAGAVCGIVVIVLAVVIATNIGYNSAGDENVSSAPSYKGDSAPNPNDGDNSEDNMIGDIFDEQFPVTVNGGTVVKTDKDFSVISYDNKYSIIIYKLNSDPELDGDLMYADNLDTHIVIKIDTESDSTDVTFTLDGEVYYIKINTSDSAIISEIIYNLQKN